MGSIVAKPATSNLRGSKDDGPLEKVSISTNDARVLDLYYRIHVEPIPLFPYTNIDHLREFLNYSPEGVRALRELNLSEFVDNSFIRRVEKEGLTQ